MGIDIGGALSSARSWVGDRLDDVEGAKDWVGEKIDGAVQSAEEGIDGFRHDLVQFGEDHGGIVGRTLAQGVSDSIGLTEGATLAVYDMGKGVVQLADGAGKLANPLEWATHGDRNLQRLESTGQALQTLHNLGDPVAWATNPGGNVETAKALWNGVTEGYQDAARDGDWSKFSGRLVVDVGSLFVGAGEANAAIKGAEGASVLGRLGEGGEAVNALDKLADGSRALDLAADAGRGADVLSDAAKAEVLAIPKGTRPNPAEYLSKSHIEQHLAQFDDGAARFMPPSNLEKYGIAQRDGSSFVIPKSEADRIEAAANRGDLAAVEEALGLKPGFFSGGGELKRVDIPNPRELGLRVPDGNEAGASDLWIPGGQLPNGIPEAVIDAGGLPESRYAVRNVEIGGSP